MLGSKEGIEAYNNMIIAIFANKWLRKRIHIFTSTLIYRYTCIVCLVRMILVLGKNGDEDDVTLGLI